MPALFTNGAGYTLSLEHIALVNAPLVLEAYGGKPEETPRVPGRTRQEPEGSRGLQ